MPNQQSQNITISDLAKKWFGASDFLNMGL